MKIRLNTMLPTEYNIVDDHVTMIRFSPIFIMLKIRLKHAVSGSLNTMQSITDHVCIMMMI